MAIAKPSSSATTIATIMEEEEDYYAPLGMPSSAFHSLMRRRFLAHLIRQLMQQRRLRVGNATDTVASHETQSAVTELKEAANTPLPSSLTDNDNDEDVQVPRPPSSVYSRDIDGNSLPPTTPVHEPPSTRTSHQSHASTPMDIPALNIRKESSDSSPNQTLASSATSMNTHSPALGAAARRRVSDVSNSTREMYSTMRKELRLRASIKKIHSRRESATIDNHKPDSHMPLKAGCAPPRPIRDGNGYDLIVQPKRQDAAMMALEDAVALMLQRNEQQQEPEVLRPPADAVLELARLCCRVRELDFDDDEIVLMASDLTTLVPVAPWEDPRKMEMASHDEIASPRVFYRDRISKRLQRRLAWLKLHYRGGSVREIEHWYRDVVSLIGWRDKEEAELPWSWRRKNGFF